MILCKDCKHHSVEAECSWCFNPPENEKGEIDYGFNSCPNAERADGLTECCETCKHYEKFCANYCQKGCFSGIDNDNINLGKMKCNEWQAMEGR